MLGVLLALLCASAPEGSVRVSFETAQATDTAGDLRRIPDGKAAATVLYFVAEGCPICNAYAGEMERIAAEYRDRGVAFLRVYPDPYMTAADVEAHTKAFGFTTPAFIDADFDFAKRSGAEMTPEAVVVRQDGSVVYRGRIDDRYLDYGKQRAAPTTRDLRDALDAVLAKREVERPYAAPLGCEIPFPLNEPEPPAEETAP